jgi:hypothetical protein
MGEVNLHPRDILNLADVKAQGKYLFSLRKAMGWPVQEMQEANGHGHGYIARLFLDDKYPWDWHWSTFVSMCEFLKVQPDFKVTGLDLVETPMLKIGLDMPALLGVGLLDAVKETRTRDGVTGQELGRRLGLGKSAVPKLEASDDPNLSSIQRLVRALGGELKFKIKEA